MSDRRGEWSLVVVTVHYRGKLKELEHESRVVDRCSRPCTRRRPMKTISRAHDSSRGSIRVLTCRSGAYLLLRGYISVPIKPRRMCNHTSGSEQATRAVAAIVKESWQECITSLLRCRTRIRRASAGGWRSRAGDMYGSIRQWKLRQVRIGIRLAIICMQ